jgi:hypothetical protein
MPSAPIHPGLFGSPVPLFERVRLYSVVLTLYSQRPPEINPPSASDHTLTR